MARFTRRMLVGSAAVATGAAVVPGSATAARRGSRAEVDVVIVGAGLSGLSAARSLVRAGRSVAVLEARDRVGGRTWTVQRGGSFIDIGGQFVGPTQTAILKLADTLGVK